MLHSNMIFCVFLYACVCDGGMWSSFALSEPESQWKLYFKLYCFLDVESTPKEGVEFVFMFEQVSITELVHKSTFYNSAFTPHAQLPLYDSVFTT